MSNVPAGTAMIVYVADDGTIIEAVDSSGAPIEIASPDLDTLSGTKFVAVGETAVKASNAIPPTEKDAPAMALKTAQSALASCCYCQILGKWYCRLSCC
jgi:hypothetical protein